MPVSGYMQEKLLLREQLWQSGAQLQQQADFCSGLGSATCCLLWSSSARENTVTHWLADVSHLDSTACISSVYRLHGVFTEPVFIPECAYIVFASVFFHAYGDAGEAPAIFGSSNPNSGELRQISG